MPNNYTGSQYLETFKLLTSRMKSVPAWQDLTTAISTVLEREVEKPRRRLSRQRDTLVYRKDEILKDLEYMSGNVYDITGKRVIIPKGTKISKAEIVKIIINGEPNKEQQDFAVVKFELNDGKQYLWNMPITAPQERSLVIQNANLLGFNFFNTELDNEDYHRIQEFISQYWPQGGTKNFVRFLSFIKNIRLELKSLYSYDTDEDENEFPMLVNKEYIDNPPAEHKDKQWYRTSHVELLYDPFEDLGNNKLDVVSLQEEFFRTIEQLFYYLAPIHLVLERVIASINLYGDFFFSIAGMEIVEYKAKWAWSNTNWLEELFIAITANNETSIASKLRWQWPHLRGHATMQSTILTEYIVHGNKKYETPDLQIGVSYSPNFLVDLLYSARIRYNWYFKEVKITHLPTFTTQSIFQFNIKINIPSMVNEIDYAKFIFLENIYNTKGYFDTTIHIQNLFPHYYSFDVIKFQSKVTGRYALFDGDEFYGKIYPLYSLNKATVHSAIIITNYQNVKTPGLKPVMHNYYIKQTCFINSYYQAKISVRR